MLPCEPQYSATRSAGACSRWAGGHWPDIARHWDLVGPPLRPSAQDVAIYAEVVGGWARAHGTPRALILGVTPELYGLPWPPGTAVAAVDHTPSMIDAVWPGPRDAVVCANWTDPPLESGSRDMALCDGGIHLLSYPHDHHNLVGALRRVVAPGGLCVFRLFVPPRQREQPGTVLRDLLAGRISNPNILKLRLGMALQEDKEQGVQLGKVWDAIHQVAPDLSHLAERIGSRPEPWLAIRSYRNCPNRYHFLSVAEVCRLFCDDPGGFTMEKVQVPSYELSERCPTVVFRRGSAAPLGGG